MKLRWKTLLAWVCGVFGLSACDVIGGAVAMYATPYGDYNVDLKVTDEGGTPIKGIKAADSFTDAQGNVKLILKGSNFCTIRLQDVDGPENGEFRDTTITEENLSLKRIKKGDGWYTGEFDATGTVKMKKK